MRVVLLRQAPGPREGIKEKAGAGSSHSTDGKRGDKGKRFDHAESPRQWQIVKDMTCNPVIQVLELFVPS